MKIKIIVDSIVMKGDLNRTNTAELFWANLPMEHTVSTWGDEIYFGTAIVADEEESKETVDLGDIGYWPPGKAICLFFGSTPMSADNEIRPASPVNLVGRIEGDLMPLKSVSPGAVIRIEQLTSEE